MYLLLSGWLPFNGGTDDIIKSNVKAGVYDFNRQEWNFVSQDGKDLVARLLERNPQKRFTAEEALNDAWVHNHAPSSGGRHLCTDVLHHLRAFQGHHEFKKAALRVVASQLEEGHVAELRSL